MQKKLNSSLNGGAFNNNFKREENISFRIELYNQNNKKMLQFLNELFAKQVNLNKIYPKCACKNHLQMN